MRVWIPALRVSLVNTDSCGRYFCNPNFDAFIEALPGTYGTEAEKKYPGINSGEYLVQRLASTYV